MSMTMNAVLRKSTVSVVGAGMIAAGVFAASTASAHEGGQGEHAMSRRAIHSPAQGEAWQSLVSPQHIERLAEHLGMSVADLKVLLETGDGREEVHTMMREHFEARRHEWLLNLAGELGMSVEDLEAAKDDPELRAQIRDEMKELGLEPLPKRDRTKFGTFMRGNR